MNPICKHQLNNFKGTDLSCIFNVCRFFLINNDSAFLRFQWFFIEILSYYFKTFITKVCMSRFYGISPNMWFQISTVMVFYALWNSTTTLTNVIFCTRLTMTTCIVFTSCWCLNLLWSFTLKQALSFLPV